MKILLIRPPTKDAYLEFKGVAPEYPPLGIAYIATVLEKVGYEVKILDFAVPYPGTEYYEEIKSQNRLRIKKWSDYAIYSSPTFVPENISVEQLINLQKEAYRRYFFRLKAFLNVLSAGLKNKDRMLSYIKLATSMIKLVGKKGNRS
mgnify:CR=1 FL=1